MAAPLSRDLGNNFSLRERPNLSIRLKLIPSRQVLPHLRLEILKTIYDTEFTWRATKLTNLAYKLIHVDKCGRSFILRFTTLSLLG